jgi:hypothetical protein
MATVVEATADGLRTNRRESGRWLCEALAYVGRGFPLDVRGDGNPAFDTGPKPQLTIGLAASSRFGQRWAAMYVSFGGNGERRGYVGDGQQQSGDDASKVFEVGIEIAA